MVTKKSIQSSGAVTVSMDIGNGFVKWRSPNGGGSYMSVIGDISGMMQGSWDVKSMDSVQPVRCIRFEGRVFGFGESVYYTSSRPQVIRDTSRIDTQYYRQLFASVLASAIEPDPKGVTVELVLSLPPGRYFEREHLKEIIAGPYAVDIVQDSKVVQHGIYNVPLNTIRVIPEGVGSVCMSILDERGHEQDSKINGAVIGVVDIGTLTTDLIMLDDLKIVRNGCWTEEVAIYSGIYKPLMDYANNLGLVIPDYRCEAVLRRGSFTVQGEEHSILALMERWWRDLALYVDGLIRQHWHGGNDVDMILLTGGGAGQVFGELRRIYKHIRLSSDNAIELVTGNADGGYRYGLFRREA